MYYKQHSRVDMCTQIVKVCDGRDIGRLSFARCLAQAAGFESHLAVSLELRIFATEQREYRKCFHWRGDRADALSVGLTMEQGPAVT